VERRLGAWVSSAGIISEHFRVERIQVAFAEHLVNQGSKLQRREFG
jgi:hypothetical protein